MKISQICFSGLGGHSSVVFSLIAANNKKITWQIGFIGNEPLSISNKINCKNFNVNHKYIKYFPGKRIHAWIKLYKWLKSSKPRFIICHSTSMIIPCFVYSIVHSTKVISVEHTPNSQKKYSEWFFGLLSMYLSYKVILLTEDYFEEIKNTYKILFISSKFRVIPNGIDTTTFTQSKKNFSELVQRREIMLGMAARFSIQKKQNLLIHVLDNLNKKQDRYKFKLSLAGDGETIEFCKSLVAEKKLDSLVFFHGFLSEADLVKWFKQVDIYLHATDGETLSTSILQAMCSGLPIIASDIDGVSNLLHQKDQYGLTSANSINAFSNTIIDLLKSPNKLKEIAKNANRKVYDDYSNFKMLEKYLDVLV